MPRPLSSKVPAWFGRKFDLTFPADQYPNVCVRLWGTPARLTEMFDAGARSIQAESRLFNFRYRSPAHFLDVFKTFYGPVLKAFAALEPAKQEELHDDLHALIVRMNRSGDATMVVPSEYLEVVITKR